MFQDHQRDILERAKAVAYAVNGPIPHSHRMRQAWLRQNLNDLLYSLQLQQKWTEGFIREMSASKVDVKELQKSCAWLESWYEQLGKAVSGLTQLLESCRKARTIDPKAREFLDGVAQIIAGFDDVAKSGHSDIAKCRAEVTAAIRPLPIDGPLTFGMACDDEKLAEGVGLLREALRESAPDKEPFISDEEILEVLKRTDILEVLMGDHKGLVC